jgi:hypothetical protein
MVAIGATVATCYHYGPWWLWWGVAVAGLGIAVVCSMPRSKGFSESGYESELDAIVKSFDDAEIDAELPLFVA